MTKQFLDNTDHVLLYDSQTLTDEEKLEYCNMHFDCMDCSGCRECCPMVNKELTNVRIEEIRIKLIKG